MNAISLQHVSYAYTDECKVLNDVNFEIEKGEFVAVIGGNGSGKSTLLKLINALVAPQSGSVRINSLDSSLKENVIEIRKQCGMVFQNPDDQIIANIIEHEVAFGPENICLNPEKIQKRVREALTLVGLQGFEKRGTATLSGGQKQRLAIAGVLAMKPKILLFDEATSMLDPRGRTDLVKLVQERNDEGITVVYVTHYMDEIVNADKVIVMDQGHISLMGTPEEVFSHADVLSKCNIEAPFPYTLSCELQRRQCTVGIHLDSQSLLKDLNISSREPSNNKKTAHQDMHNQPQELSDTPLISLKNVSFSYHAFKRPRPKSNEGHQWGNQPGIPWSLSNVSLKIYQGDFVGIAGHTGSGKSTLIQLISGILAPSEGEILLKGIPFASNKKKRMMSLINSAHIGYVMQYPERQLFSTTVEDDIAFGPRNYGLEDADVLQRVHQAMELVQLDYNLLAKKSPFELSGGQQRRVALASVLSMNPKLLVLDEPAAGLDPHSHHELIELLQSLNQEQEVTIILVSHNMEDLARVSKKLLVLNQGELYKYGSPLDIFTNENDLHKIGLGVPCGLQIAKEAGLGFDVKYISTSLLADDIASHLKSCRKKCGDAR